MRYVVSWLLYSYISMVSLAPLPPFFLLHSSSNLFLWRRELKHISLLSVFHHTSPSLHSIRQPFLLSFQSFFFNPIWDYPAFILVLKGRRMGGGREEKEWGRGRLDVRKGRIHCKVDWAWSGANSEKDSLSSLSRDFFRTCDSIRPTPLNSDCFLPSSSFRKLAYVLSLALLRPSLRSQEVHFRNTQMQSLVLFTSFTLLILLHSTYARIEPVRYFRYTPFLCLAARCLASL